jgi:acyl-coenzyme A thioesterase PaaI-like protein
VEVRVPNTHYVLNDFGLVAGGVTVLLEHCGGDGNNSNIIKQQGNVGIDSEYDCHCSGKVGFMRVRKSANSDHWLRNVCLPVRTSA